MSGDTIEQKITRPEQLEDGGDLANRKSAEAGYHDKILNHEAKQGAEAEHNMGLIQAIKTYRRAALWSICRSLPPPLTVVMEILRPRGI